jgi:hypothetical protein
MRTQLGLLAVIVFIASPVFAQAPPRTPRTAETAQAPQAPAAPVAPLAPAVSAAPAPPPPPAPPGPPRREGQPINVKVELNISEEGGGNPPVRKTISAVVGDSFSGYVRENAFTTTPSAGAFNRVVPLNLDAYPVILANGKIRLTCTIQYNAGGASATSSATDPRSGTDIKQNLVLILDSGKSLVVSQATDPVSDRRVTVEVTATILR